VRPAVELELNNQLVTIKGKGQTPVKKLFEIQPYVVDFFYKCAVFWGNHNLWQLFFSKIFINRGMNDRLAIQAETSQNQTKNRPA
jgi:hypothetical protein